MSGGSRSLPVRPSLRFLKLEAKRRLAAGEFTTLHEAQAAMAREHGLPSWAGLKQACATPPEPESHALDQLRWVASRVPDLAELMGPVIPCGGPRGTIAPSNGGYCVLGQLIADVTGLPYASAAARLVLDPLGMRDSRFPGRAADIGPGAVTGYTVTVDGAFEAFPAQVSTMQAIAGLWSTGADLVRLATGWSSLLPAALARAAVAPQIPQTPQTPPGPGGLRVGLGWLLPPGDQTAVHGGAGLEAVALLRSRLRDGRAHVVLASRSITVESVDNRLLHSWTNPQTS